MPKRVFRPCFPSPVFFHAEMLLGPRPSFFKTSPPSCEGGACPVRIVDNCEAKRRNQCVMARLQHFVRDSRWQPSDFFPDCRNTELKRIPSYLAPYWHCLPDRVLSLVMLVLLPLRGQTRHCETCSDTRCALSSCVLGRARFLELYVCVFGGAH